LPPSGLKKTTASALFFAVIAVNVMDRQMMAILGEAIKLDLGLSDVALGALAGPLFAVFYAVSGLPIAMLADRTDRVLVLGWATAIAGVFAIIGGFAGGFWLLAASRAAVAIGDAGGPPAIWSLVSSYYPKEKRARAIGVIQLGAPAGAVGAFILGGILVASFGWRSGFFVIGGAGIMIGLLCLALVGEPRRAPTSDGQHRGDRGFLKTLLTPAPMRWGLAGVAAAGMAMFGLGIWSPSVLQRVYGWPADQTGLALGGATAIAGFLGTYLGGWIATRRRRNGDAGAEFSVPFGAMLVAAPLAALSLMAPSGWAVIVIYGFLTTCLLAWNAPSIAAFQLIAPERSRGVAASLHVFFVNMLGLGVGPLAIGGLSDFLTPSMGAQALFVAVAAVVAAAACVAAFCFGRAATALKRFPSAQGDS